jgi:hypothetical protein
MNYTFSLDAEIKKSIVNSAFYRCLPSDNFTIEFSDLRSPKSKYYWRDVDLEMIEGTIYFDHLLLDYDSKCHIVRIYLPDVTRILPWTMHDFDDILGYLVYHAVGRWICQTVKLDGEVKHVAWMDKKGKYFTVFISQLLAYHLMTDKRRDHFLMFSGLCLPEYLDFKNFIGLNKFNKSYKNTIDLPIDSILDLIQTSRLIKGEISKEFITDYFKDYIEDRIHRCPEAEFDF